MGSDTCRKHLQNINQHLNEFQNKPKKIEGNLIFDWFNVIENLYEEFYNLGISVKWSPSEIIKNQAEIAHIILRISEYQGWFQTFITIYPGLRVDLEGATPAVNVCRVRSGIEFLLRGFSNINKSFDKVIDDLKDLGELQEFDEHLNVWKVNHRPDFFPGDRHTDTPKSHWWWF